jgi:hypothetical protein
MTTDRIDREELLCGVDLAELLENLGERRGLARRGTAFPCPNAMHEQTGDTPPATVSIDSAGYGVWRCHACEAGGTAIDALTKAGAAADVAEAFEQITGPAQRRPERPAAPAPVRPSGSIPEKVLERLHVVKGWTEPVLTRLGIGWDGQRVTIPIRDVEGREGMVRYLPNADVHGKRKMLADRGSQRQLFPAPESLEGDEAWVVEGEPDAISAHSLGLPGTGVPGTEGWKTVWAQRFAHFKRVVVVGDCDEPGRKLARTVSADIAALGGPEVRRVDLDPQRTDKWDIGDALVENLADRLDFANLLRTVAAAAPLIDKNEAEREQMVLRAESSGLPLTLRDGADIVAAADATVPGVWGEHPHVLWAKGEAFMIAGSTGTGKTTLAQQILLRRMGVKTEPLFDLAIETSVRPVLYLAIDRENQAARSFRRMASELPRGRLLWHADLGLYNPTNDVPERFIDWLMMHRCGTLVIDSLYALIGSGKDEMLGWYTQMVRALGQAEIELLVLHHFRKGSGEEGGALIDRVYGGAQVTWSAGSVLAISGEPGDDEVEAYHVKQPGKTCGPWTLRHDHEQGVTSAAKHPSPIEMLRILGHGSLKDIAAGCKREGKYAQRRVSQELDSLVRQGTILYAGEEYRVTDPLLASTRHVDVDEMPEEARF